MAENYMEDMAKEYNKMLKDVDLTKAGKVISDSLAPAIAQSDLTKRIRDVQGTSLINQAKDIINTQLAYIDCLLCQALGRTRYKILSYLRSIKYTTLRKLNQLLSQDTLIPAHADPIVGCSQASIINTLISLQIDLFQILDAIANTTNIDDIIMLENRAMSLIALLT